MVENLANTCWNDTIKLDLIATYKHQKNSSFSKLFYKTNFSKFQRIGTNYNCQNFFFSFFQGQSCSIWKFLGQVGVEQELQLLAPATATTMPHLSRICNLWQCRILNPLIKARDRTHIFMDPCQVLNPLSHNENSYQNLMTKTRY